VTGLLAGMRVLDAGIWRPMPHATQMLADLGATVVKLEPPGGDPMRHFPELFGGVASRKRSIVVDLRTDAGRARALDLAARCDVFTEGWRPGVADRLGLGWDALHAVNPRVVYCSLSGYGQDGPLASRPGHDVNYQALAGALASRDGTAPAIPRVPIADLAAATVAATVICAAWARRCADGDAFAGERIDVAMAEVVATWSGTASVNTLRGRAEPARGSAGYGVFATADGGSVSLGVIAEDHFWAAVCDALGLGDVRDLAYGERLDRVEECNARVAGAIAALTTADALDRLVRAGAPVAPVLAPEEVVSEPQFVARGLVVRGADGRACLRFPARIALHDVAAPGPVPYPGADDAATDPWS
jgi:crotonobetainyl-CoA:carnitine CoA-transferase CaiB-like acyl-CoA transferase